MLLARGVLDANLEPKHDGDTILFPISNADDVEGLVIVDGDFKERKRAPRSYSDLLTLGADLTQLLPKSFDIVGDIVVIKLPDKLLPYQEKVGRALLGFVPGARVVAVDGGVKGTARVRDLEVVAGEGPLTTVYKENGISFRVDLGKVYFSPRLSREHSLVAKDVKPGERVLDLFCGMGAFALTILRKCRGTTAVAVDSNHHATELARLNAKEMGVGDRLEVVEQDAGLFLKGENQFDRVIMNLPREGYKYLSSVGPRVRARGRLHYYGIYPNDAVDSASGSVISALSSGEDKSKWSLAGSRVVHEYSPASLLMALTVSKDGEVEHGP